MTTLMLKLINMSLTASWLILAVIAARLLLKRAPRWMTVLLWGLVGVRLICPFTIESALSLIPRTEVISPSVIAPAETPIQNAIPAADAGNAPGAGQIFEPTASAASADLLQIWLPILTAVWCTGVILLLLYGAVSYGRLRRKVCTAVRLQDNVFQSEAVPSPFILGILQPKIYLPFSLTENELPAVLAHERAHIARLDHWWKPAGFLLLAVYWFNPLMWVSYVLLCRDIELACDERVIREMTPDERAHYSEALLRCSVRKGRITSCPLAFGEQNVRERVKSILNYKKPAFWIMIAAILACIVVAACFLTSPKEKQQPLLDLNRNGIEEELKLTEDSGSQSQTVEIYENGERIFYEEGSIFHVGWNALFLCTLDGESYLLRYNPTMYQGSCGYTYELFTLEDGGRTIAQNEVLFDVNFDAPYHDPIDTDAVDAFLNEINGYLSHSEQLLNTDANLLYTFKQTGRLEDDLCALFSDYEPDGFTRDDTKTPAENLRLLEQAESASAVSGIEAVLSEGAQFLYFDDDREISLGIQDVPSFLDPDGGQGIAVGIGDYSLTDLDGDGISEAIIEIPGIAGSHFHILVLHEIGDHVYGYFFTNRDFEDLKTDGTYIYSDPTGVQEQGICRITGFTEKSCTIDKIAYGTGTYKGLTEFFVDHQPATEEAFLDALSRQGEKESAQWYNW